MQKLIVMTGIAGSGKSTVAERLASQEDAVLLSSDALREELLGDINCQDNGGLIFDTMYARARNNIKLGRNVILDATNITSKRRRGIINMFGDNVQKICYYVDPGFQESVMRNFKRDRQVPMEVLDRMYKTLHVPMYNEGWDEIIYDLGIMNKDSELELFTLEKMLENKSSHDTIFTSLEYHKAFMDIIDFAQDTTFHTFSISRHTWHVYEYIFDNYEGEDKNQMLWAALLHDVGKAYCKNFKDGARYANFIGHDNVSAQMAVRVLSRIGYADDYIEKVVEIVQLHMRLPWGSEDYRKDAMKLCSLVGADVFDKLCLFRKADEYAR